MSELSEEQIINSIKPIVNARKTHKDNHLYNLQLNAYQLDAIQGLLHLYNKEKEKNKKYQDVISNLNKNWVSKEELRKKLNELKEKEQELSDEQGYWGGTELQNKIEIFEELLEERN